ncbi:MULTISPECIES: hypothetical protein [Clostridium]|uniref:DUF8042 domain-containing protein n=1 Tax=Clostridium lapidicellarium TaxID=3240931 RepID=A0ABV4DUY8_9CLOT
MNEKIDALKTADEYMYNLKRGIKSVVDKFQSGKENDALNLLPLVIDGLQWMAQIIVLTKDVQKREINLSKFNCKLKETVKAIENEDYVLISDIFDYEIIPILEDTHKVIKNSIALYGCKDIKYEKN